MVLNNCVVLIEYMKWHSGHIFPAISKPFYMVISMFHRRTTRSERSRRTNRELERASKPISSWKNTLSAPFHVCMRVGDLIRHEIMPCYMHLNTILKPSRHVERLALQGHERAKCPYGTETPPRTVARGTQTPAALEARILLPASLREAVEASRAGPLPGPLTAPRSGAQSHRRAR